MLLIPRGLSLTGPDREPEITHAAKQEAVADAGQCIRNFRNVTEWLYRGGQPDYNGIKLLKNIGIKTVISLRWNQKIISRERALVEEAGIAFESIRLNYWTFPKEGVVARFLSILDDLAKRPTFIHCLHGSDRTGLLIAMYRMSRMGWDADAAYKEMRDCGFHRLKMHHFKWAVYDFARQIKRGQHLINKGTES